MSGLLRSIRLPLMAITLLLAALAVAPALSALTTAWHDWEARRAAAAMNQAAGRLNEGLFELLLERAQGNAALRAEAPASASAQAAIARHRETFEAKLQEAMVHLRAAALPETTRMLAELEAMAPQLAALRTRADAQMRLALDARDADFARGGLHREISRFVAMQQGIWADLLAAAGAVDPALARLNMVKQASWLARDASGRERSTVAGAIAAGTAVTAAGRATIAGSRGAVDSAWRLVEAEPEVRTEPRLQAALAAARARYFEEFRTLSAQQSEPSAQRLAAGDFISRTTPLIGSLLGVRDAADAVTQERVEALVAEARNRAIMAGGVLLGTLMALVLAGWVVARRVLKPVAVLHAATGELAAGRYDTEVAGTARQDEFGALARALETLRQEALRAQSLDTTRESERAAGAEERRKARADLAGRIETALGSALSRMDERLATLREAGTALSSSVAQTAGLAGEVSEDAGLASRNVQTVAAAAEELSASVSEITRQVAEAARVAGRALEETRATDGTMAELSSAAGKVGEVVRLISDIAGQTNLLALNATIEAARAGEAGKGFAVVASEVKSLAAQTGRATGDIAAQINAIQAAAEGAVRSIQGIGQVVAEIHEVAGAIAAAVEEQGAATREIARNVAEAATGTDRVSDRMGTLGQSAAAAEQSIERLRESTEGIARQGADLRGELSGLLQGLRAA